ncbi:hypothetical protein DKX38_014464 [Salix brachista]|uniref:Multidrug and toxic compound extrusion protein n=1 Tax=Salix brachista TaxID=2182728 RepID=A0A5N5LFS8_9ROSI|nr:hypothetical protein DKX38_014464 [Salix brachista]
MPELLYGSERSSEKARMLLKSLVITGAILGLLVASIGASIPRLLPFTFTSVLNVTHDFRAGRDLKFISLSMTVYFTFGALLLLVSFVSSILYRQFRLFLISLHKYRHPIVPVARFFFALQRLLSPKGIPNQEPPVQYKLGEVKASLSKIKLSLFYDVLTRPTEHARHARYSILFMIRCQNPNLSSQNQELFDTNNEIEGENDSKIGSILEEEEIEVDLNREGLENQSLWSQIKEIVVFTGPATGLWLCGPLMSLIDTVVIGQGSYIELAALGPATVLCDYMSYVFMFLSIATSNMVATYLARGLDGETRGLLMVVKLTLEVIGNLWFVGSQIVSVQDKNQVQHQISILLFVGMTCGLLMLVFTRFFGSWALTAFSGPKNAQILPAANTYVQIRGLAWPAVLVGWVAQSASLGMKDSWGPLKALAVSSVVNGVGDVVLCSFLGYGIAGAAWATMVSQVIAGYMMIEALNKKGYDAFAISVPTLDEILTIIGLAAPVFVTMISKVAFYSLMIYSATSMGTHSVAAHQVMLQIMGMCTVMGEPLSQTAQSFMPELIYGVNRSLEKARRLLKSLVTIGSTMGLLLGTIGTFAPWLFPNIFTRDQKVIQEMYKVLLPFFMAIAVTPSIHCLEGTLLAGRDLRFLSFSMTGCFSLGAVALMLFSSRGYGLPGCWYALVGFQWARFFLSLRRLLSLDGVLFSKDLSRYEMEKLKMHKVLIPYFIALITLKGIAGMLGLTSISI